MRIFIIFHLKLNHIKLKELIKIVELQKNIYYSMPLRWPHIFICT